MAELVVFLVVLFSSFIEVLSMEGQMVLAHQEVCHMASASREMERILSCLL